MSADTPATTRVHEQHEHRFGPFGAEPDPSEYDELIASAAGAVWGSGCEPCLAGALTRLASSVPAMARLLELHVRAFGDGADSGPDRFRHYFPMYTDLASLIEATPSHREEIITRLDPGARSLIADAAVRTLTGQWAVDVIRAEHDAEAEAWRARFAHEATRWGWAVLRETETATSDSDFDRWATVGVAATADLDDTDYLLEPVEVADAATFAADRALHRHGWGLTWGWEAVSLDSVPLDSNSSRLRRCWIGRVRYPAIDRHDRERVPYAEDVRWSLESDRHYPEPTSTGSPPGRVRAALRLLAGGTEADDAAAAAAREVLEGYRQQLHAALVAHGWPQAGVDDARLARVVLAWVAADPDPARRRACIERLAADIEAGTADPAHLEALKASAVLPVVELYDVIRRAYPE